MSREYARPMPLYEYACRGCAAHVEVKQSFTDAPLTICDACGGELRRVLQPVGIVFKGSGWYVTDSRPTSKDDGAKSDKAA